MALLPKAANQLITAHFKYTPGISAAPVVGRKNARVCISDRNSGLSVPPFEMVMDHGLRVFEVQEKADLSGVSNEELQQLVEMGSAAKQSTVD